MAEIYRAVFTCPELDERTVWYVSNRRAADIMLSRHIRTEASTNIASKYKRVEYTMTMNRYLQAPQTQGMTLGYRQEWTYKKKR